MTFLALIAIIFFGFAVYNLTCAFVDIPTKKTSQMMMLSLFNYRMDFIFRM